MLEENKIEKNEEQTEKAKKTYTGTINALEKIGNIGHPLIQRLIAPLTPHHAFQLEHQLAQQHFHGRDGRRRRHRRPPRCCRLPHHFLKALLDRVLVRLGRHRPQLHRDAHPVRGDLQHRPLLAPSLARAANYPPGAGF